MKSTHLKPLMLKRHDSSQLQVVIVKQHTFQIVSVAGSQQSEIATDDVISVTLLWAWRFPIYNKHNINLLYKLGAYNLKDMGINQARGVLQKIKAIKMHYGKSSIQCFYSSTHRDQKWRYLILCCIVFDHSFFNLSLASSSTLRNYNTK